MKTSPITRRNFLKAAGAASVALALKPAPAGAAPAAGGSGRRPNVLLVLCDQLRRDALGCHGDPDVKTPNLDRLAAEGVRFDAACSTYPVCVPYRFTLITGQYAHSRLVPAINWRMSPAERTLADEFNEAGWDTVYVGKWHLGGGAGPSLMNRPVPREHQGRWKKWYGFEFRNSYFDTCWFEDDDPTPRRIEGYQTDGLFDVAMKDLRARKGSGRPFAMCLSVEAPHPPFEAPEEDEARWRGREMKLPPNFMVLTEHDEQATGWSAKLEPSARDAMLDARRIYAAMVENLDRNVGRLRKFLEEEGLAKDTIVVFTSDHGELAGSHSLREKQYPYEESAGVPLLAWGPGCGIPAGRVLAEPTCTEDLFPTLLGLAGVAPRGREPLPGQDLSAWVRGGAAPKRPGVMLEFVAETRPGVLFGERQWRGWRSERYKYVVFGGGREGMKPWQFFDLREDPYELKNLVADPAQQARIAEHHRWLRARMAETGDHATLAPAHGAPALNPWGEVKPRKRKAAPAKPA